jgi:deoxyribodipyrimidine photolyase-related protein
METISKIIPTANDSINNLFIIIYKMTYKFFIILPTQLFEEKYIHVFVKNCTILLWECPWYFNNPKYNFNKKKLILHKASMEHYYNYLTDRKYNVKKILYNEKISFNQCAMFDPIDQISLLKIPKSVHLEESPNFLLTKDDYEKYRKKTDKFFFNAFYMFGKSIINVIPSVKSTDKENRKSLTKKQIETLNIPKVANLGVRDKEYIDIASSYVNKNFKNNPGDVNDFMFPVTHSTAKRWLDHFIKKKVKMFGDYQDFINKEDDYMFHSLLSTSINIGLLNPTDIIKTITKYKAKIPMNSFEGYIRQLFWREYQRYTYIYFYNVLKNRNLNYFGNTKSLGSKWYTGDIKIQPVDDAINKGFSTGYLHHINRLMVIGNFMNLSGISPQQGFKWFMEFSCDSYDWVMCQNVLGMAFFADGGKTMRRPYISSSNYILKMSNYTKGNWSDIWDTLYREFIKNHKKELKKYRYFFPKDLVSK